ncbi:SulP family inorganic anion transporter [Gryllotalpicola ginsengisoli]|uniref:SulP family inorganic anion transporter n=1 Tax=Gryllotalpicola ginsengisoli TaxID=444608 RepID=UPI0003B71823|nr:SulP family inorganic anion transporter [Gryllotalpicola ginsengisoli]
MALLAGTTRRSWRGDALRGIPLAATAAPVAMAFAQFAGLPAAAGLYALIVPGILFALFAGAGRLTAAPDALLVVLVAATLTPLARPGTGEYLRLAAAQAIVAAGVLALLALLRANAVANLLPRPALLGVGAAVALDLVVREIAAMFGIRLADTVTDTSTQSFLQHVAALLTGLPRADAWGLLLAAIALVVLLVGRRILRLFPWELAVMAATIAAYEVFGLAGHGVSVVGGAPHGVGLAWPAQAAGQWAEVVPGAVVLALTALALQLDADPARAVPSGRHGLVLGVANAASGLGGGFAIGPSQVHRRRLDELGASGQLPTLVAALLVLLTALLAPDALAALPTPALGAIAVVATWPLLRAGEARALWRGAPGEFLFAAACFAAVLALGPLPGLGVAAALSLLRLLGRASEPPIDVVDADGRPIASLRKGAPPPRTSAPGVVIVRYAARIDSAGAGALARGIRAAVAAEGQGVTRLVLDCEAVTGIDATGAAVLRDARAWAAERGVAVDYSRARAVLRVELERHGLLGTSRVFRTNRDALGEV